MDRRRPVRLRQRHPLVVRDRDDRHLAELVVDGLQVRDVEPAVERGHVGHAEAPRHREVEVVDVPVNDVEPMRRRRDRLQLDDLVRERIDDRLVEPQAARRAGDQLGGGPGIPAREERHVVALPDELFRQVGDDALGPAVSGGRDALHQWCDLCDSHREHPSFSWCPGTSG